MTNVTAPTHRSGQSDVSQEEARSHTVLISVEDRPGSIDRVIGVLRRRRANLQTLTLGNSSQSDSKRITATVNDSEVGIDQLLEQLRKIVDVRQAVIPQPEQTIVREMALIKVNSGANSQEILDLGRSCAAVVVDTAPDFVTFEITGSAEKIAQFVDRVQLYGIREIARSGSVTIARASDTK